MHVNLWTASALSMAFAAAGLVCAAHPVDAPKRPEGIWKAAVPPKAMKGEFDNLDPLGVVAGTRIAADCSLNWIDPDDGRLYCFASGTSLEFFLDQPQVNIQRARAAWRRMALQRQ
jgi:predicted alpha/beta-hydrolase family hydrolase